MEIADIREKAHGVCIDYLGGVWKSINPEDIIIEKIHGGLINDMFQLTLPPEFEPIGNEPKQVFMKNFSDKLKIGPFGIMIENIIVLLLSEKKIAPKVYGIFDGGRLEEFIESRNITTNDFDDPKTLENIMRNLARMHCLNAPINKDPGQWEKKFEDLVQQALSNDPPDEIKKDPILVKQYEKYVSLNPREDFEWISKLRDSVKSPIVLCHNDFHMNNMLLLTSSPESSDDRIRFVDYELSGYNHRASDINRLLGSFCFEILQEPPYLNLNWEKYPTEEKKKEIFKCYLNEIQKETKCNMDMDEAFNQLSKEVQVFRLMECLLSIPFCFKNPFEMKVKIDFSRYIDRMIANYLKEKELFLNTQEK